ncbi:MAG: EamA family transporter [Kiritimatiellaeota bacterium]|nr:EamA family transporter [Kiritimatiellota bacterium]
MWQLILASLIWSLSFGMIGNVLADLPPAGLAMIRLAVAAAVFLPFVRPASVRIHAALVGIGALQFGIMSLAYTGSFRYLKSHEVALFTVMTPVYVAVISDCFQRRFNALNLGAAAVAVTGAGVVLWQGGAPEVSLVGFLLVELSNLCFALGQLLYRELFARAERPLTDRQSFFWLYLGGFAATLPLGLRDVGFVTAMTGPQWLALAHLAVVASGLSFFLWNSGARKVSAGTLAVMNNLKIPLGVLASLLIFRERINLGGLLAGLLLMAVALWLPHLQKERTCRSCFWCSAFNCGRRMFKRNTHDH